MQKIRFKWGGGGGSRKDMVRKGRVTKKIAFKFDSDSICDNANISTRMPKNSVSKVLKIQNFPGEHASRPPYFTIYPTATLPHQRLRYKMQLG